MASAGAEGAANKAKDLLCLVFVLLLVFPCLCGDQNLFFFEPFIIRRSLKKAWNGLLTRASTTIPFQILNLILPSMDSSDTERTFAAARGLKEMCLCFFTVVCKANVRLWVDAQNNCILVEQLETNCWVQ